MRTAARAGATAAIIGSVLAAGLLGLPSSAAAGTAADIEPLEVAFNRSVVAEYHSEPADDSVVVPSSVTTIVWQLPQEVTSLGLSASDFWIEGGGEYLWQDDVSIDPTTREATTTFAQGELSAAAVQRDAAGRPFLRFTFSDYTHYPTKYQPPLVYSSGPLANEGRLDLQGIIVLGAADGSTAATVSLDSSQATSFAHSATFWSHPEPAVWVRPGRMISVAGTGASSTSTIEARLDDRNAPPAGDDSRTPLPATLSADGTRVEIEVPADLDLNEELADDGTLRLTVTVTDGTGQTLVWADATAAQASTRGSIDTTRISGVNRYAGAAAVARAGYPTTAERVFLPSGDTFADALSVAPVAALEGAPVLLASTAFDPRGVMPQIIDYVHSFRPGRVTIIGGPASVRYEWAQELKSGGTLDYVDRIEGQNRYEVSRQVALTEFPQGADTVFITTGATFPDALSAVPAAVARKAPIILVNGSAPGLDAETADVLSGLGATKIVIVGGPVSVSSGIKADLVARFGDDDVQRIGGADRFAVAEAVNRAAFTSAPHVYLATGLNFPDALTGGVLAASEGAPLLLARTDCVPPGALDAMADWGTTRVTLLGGPSSLTTSVLDLEPCST